MGFQLKPYLKRKKKILLPMKQMSWWKLLRWLSPNRPAAVPSFITFSSEIFRPHLLMDITGVFFPSPPQPHPLQLPQKRRSAWNLRKHSSGWQPWAHPCVICGRWKEGHCWGAERQLVAFHSGSTGSTPQGTRPAAEKQTPCPCWLFLYATL